MSYILGALKKAENERKPEKELDFNNWDQKDWVRPSQPKTQNNQILYVLLSALLLVLIIFSFLAYRILIKPAPVAADNPVPTAAIREVHTSKPAAMGIEDARVEQAVPVYISPYQQQAQPASVPKEPPKTSAPMVKLDKRPEPTMSLNQDSNRGSGSSQAATSLNRINPPDLPEFSGHIYFANNSRLSRVFSGSNSFREGETVGGYRIKSIREGEVLLDYQGQEFRVRSSQ